MKEGKSDDGEDEYVIRLKGGENFSECVSGLQKCLRRGWLREALTLALGLYDSGYGAALARRLVLVAVEDCGLGDANAVSQVCVLCTAWLAIRKEHKDQPDVLPLAMGVMLLCSAKKSREVDSACVVVREEQKRGIGLTVRDVITKHHDLIVDSHTSAGSARLRKVAAERGISYERMSWLDFLTVGAVIEPRVEVDGDKWTKRVLELFEVDESQIGKR